MRTIHQMFRDEAARSPDAVAVAAGDRRVTYAELDALSDRKAAALHALGIGPGRIVPVALPRSVRLVATLLGVFKTGAAATVVDPEWPSARIAGLVRQLDADFVVADGELGTVPVITELDGTGAVPDDHARCEDPCLVFFTSGSTGEPKGALVPHAGLTGLVARPTFADFGLGAVMPLAAALPWDMAAMELWGMLATGGTSVLPESSPPTGRQIRAMIAGPGVTLMWLTTSLFNAFVDEDPDCFTGLRQVIVGGERLSPAHCGRFLWRHPGIELTNGYGPAEATCLVTTHSVTPADVDREHGIPIGTPVPNTELFVVDGERECGPGEIGELWVAGPRVALRYVGDHPANATAFRDWRGRRVYRTGDLVYSADGLLHFVGRADRQLKINGHRVEPAEVERAAAGAPGVRRAVALPSDGGLALFVSGSAPQPVAARLAATLPAYLRPATIRQVAEFPLTGNGKLDHRRLLAELAEPERQAPEYDDEQRLVATELAAVLGRSGIPAGVPLTGLGVGSLQLIRLGMRLERRTGRIVDVARLLRARDLAGLADVVRSSAPVMAVADADGPVPLTPTQTAFLLRSMEKPSDTSSLCPLLWRISGDVDVIALRAVLQDVAARHEALRAHYEFTEPPTAVVDEPTVDLAETTDVAGSLSRPLDPETGPVWRAALSGTEFGIVVHHIAFDGWSETVLARDIGIAYAARVAGTAPVFDAPAPSLRTLAAERTRHGRYRYEREHVDRYRKMLAGAADLELRDRTPPAPCGDAHAVTRRIPANALDGWSADGASRFSGLLAAVCRALAGHVRVADLVVGIPVVMRTGHAEENAVGCLINTVCVRPGVLTGVDRATAIRTAHASVTEAIALRDIAFVDLVRELDPPRTGRNPIYQVLFTVADDVPLDLPGCAAEFVRRDLVRPPTELHVEIRPGETTAEISVAYQCEHVPDSAADAIADAVAAQLSEPVE